MKTIFVNYRREESSGHAGRLFDGLKKHFGREKLFLDVAGNIEHGEPFDKAIERAVDSCGVFLAVIGRNWLSSVDANGKQRLSDSNDYVRLEIAKALERQIRVIPVLVDNAKMPRAEELPKDLMPLSKHQAIELSENRWEFDLSQLIVTIEKILGPKRLGWSKVAAAILLLAAITFGIWAFWPSRNHSLKKDDTNSSFVSPVTDNTVNMDTPSEIITDQEPKATLCDESFQWDSEFNSCVRNSNVPAKKFSIPLDKPINEIRGNIYFYLNRERLPDINGRAEYKENPGVVHAVIAVMREKEMIGTAREVIYTTSEGNICNISDLPETTGHLKKMKVAYSIGLMECMESEGGCTANLDPNGNRVTITLKPFTVTIGKDCKG